MLTPAVWLVWTSLGEGAQFFAGYKALFDRGFGFTGVITLWSMLQASLLMALILAAFKTLFAMLAAYALVFFRVKFSSLIFYAILLTLYLPLTSRALPTYLVVDTLGLVNTHGGLYLPLLSSALGVLLFRQFFNQVPTSLMEAARIDGAGPVKFFLDCLLPISLPFVAALFVIHFVEGWNEYLWPGLVFVGEENTVVMRGLALVSLNSSRGLALAVVAMVPPAILVLFLGPQIARAMRFDSSDR